jgi:alpha,alpha-trehalose-phosphate synthase [UDP-forming]
MRGRLINVSNRLPIHIRKHAGGPRVTRSSGGLATALDSLWRDQPGVWIGWPGVVQGPEVDQLLAKTSAERTHQLKPVTLSSDEISKFYAGFANEIVWPLFHDMPTLCNFDPDYWNVYDRVNQKFARAIAAESSTPEDFIWVHDYHLMLVGHYLRQAGIEAGLSFFLHIPFPAPDVFEKLPWREPILQSLLKFDLIGFQTPRDCNNFVRSIQRLVPDARIEPSDSRTVICAKNRTSLVGAFPISIDFDGFAEHANRPEIAARSAQMRADLKDNILILGVDRMDYTKGIPERLKAFRVALRQFRELRRRVTFVQVVVPSREDIPNYKQLRREVELLVSQINGEFTQPGWVPIHYMHRSLGRDDLLAYYRAADIALITPLKDGMNLVAKEFCAAQIDERGIVIISEFAGASQELREGAILVNPNDVAAVADAIHTACRMPRHEKQERMRLLRNIVRENNVQRWARSFIQAADSFGSKSDSLTTAEVSRRDLAGGEAMPQHPERRVATSPASRNAIGEPPLPATGSYLTKAHDIGTAPSEEKIIAANNS